MQSLVSSFHHLPALVASRPGWQGPELASLVLVGTHYWRGWFRGTRRTLAGGHDWGDEPRLSTTFGNRAGVNSRAQQQKAP
jgi:hypothetical protein